MVTYTKDSLPLTILWFDWAHLGNSWLTFFSHFQFNDESSANWRLELASSIHLSSISAGIVDWQMMAGDVTPDAASLYE